MSDDEISHDYSDEDSNNDDKQPKQSRWWWFCVNLNTVEDAINWSLPDIPKFKYAIWRAHTSPSNGKPHIHCMANYSSPVRRATMKRRGYRNVKCCRTKKYQLNIIGYITEDNHKNGSPKNPIAKHVEIGYHIPDEGEVDIEIKDTSVLESESPIKKRRIILEEEDDNDDQSVKNDLESFRKYQSSKKSKE